MPTATDCTTPAAPPATTGPSRAGALTFPQVRAILTNTALRDYTRWQLMAKLAGLGALPPNVAHHTDRALAMRLAWALLPGGSERGKGGRP